MPLFKAWIFLMNRPCRSTLHKCNTKQNQTRAKLHYTRDSAYMSISAFISASRLTSLVGCHKPMSKCLFGKGHTASVTALPRSRNRKNLLIYFQIALHKGQCLHVNLSIYKCIQTDCVGGMPQTHVKMPLRERTHSICHSFAQIEGQEKSVNIFQ